MPLTLLLGYPQNVCKNDRKDSLTPRPFSSRSFDSSLPTFKCLLLHKHFLISRLHSPKIDHVCYLCLNYRESPSWGKKSCPQSSSVRGRHLEEKMGSSSTSRITLESLWIIRARWKVPPSLVPLPRSVPISGPELPATPPPSREMFVCVPYFVVIWNEPTTIDTSQAFHPQKYFRLEILEIKSFLEIKSVLHFI